MKYAVLLSTIGYANAIQGPRQGPRNAGGMCPRCGGQVRVIAAITDSTLIHGIIEHYAKGARAPPRSSLH